MKKGIEFSIVALLSCFSLLSAKVEVFDKKFDTAGAMLAYTEFELSGEPLAEGLGLDLDTLDPYAINVPTKFDYTAGIESYEYSEEAMYALNYQSKNGIHLANGVLNAKRGADMQSLAKRFEHLAKVTGNDMDIIPQNLYPLAIPYSYANPTLDQKPDLKIVGNDEIVLIKDAKEQKISTAIPAYFRDYKTLSWKNGEMSKEITPEAIGASLLKDVMWAQDFLGGMHTIDKDEELEVSSSNMDKKPNIALGVSAADGMNGVILMEMALEKTLFLQEKLAFDGKNLGVKFDPSYDASKPIWFASAIKVIEGNKNGVKSIDSLSVSNPESTLRGTWQLLWPVSELFAFSDQRVANKAQNPAFLAVFDGDPFKATPKQNMDSNDKNDVVGDDTFSVALNLSNLLFQNISKLHFNKEFGTLVDRVGADDVNIYDAAYSIEALRIYQRAVDALPVGYASADRSRSLNSKKGADALKLIKQQADFLIANVKDSNSLYASTYNVKSKVKGRADLATQFAVIRGLSSAYLATKDSKYKKESRELFLNIEKHMYNPKLGTYVDSSAEYTPYTVAAVSGGLRSAINQLKNDSFEKEPKLELKFLVDRYTEWFDKVINGGMQQAEWLGDSGEFITLDALNSSNDGDSVPPVHVSGVAAVVASKIRVVEGK